MFERKLSVQKQRYERSAMELNRFESGGARVKSLRDEGGRELISLGVV